jgi:hypothetical protein
MGRQQNTYAKRQRETEKKRKAEEKRQRRSTRASSPPQIISQAEMHRDDQPGT